MDEALRTALLAFRDKFACNSISGCPAEAELIGLGWVARPYLEQLFEKAPAQATYRARAVRVVAELRDPGGLPFLLGLVGHRDTEIRAQAIYGVGLLHAKQHRAGIASVADDDVPLWQAPPKLSALWVLHLWGDAAAGQRFVAYLKELAPRQMANAPLTWGIDLCGQPGAPRCAEAMAQVASNPGFTARRAAVRFMARQPRPEYAAALVALSGDTVRSIADLAQAALRQLSGRPTLEGRAAWQAWCAEVRCEQEALPQAATPTSEIER